jgi:hypothetical protein
LTTPATVQPWADVQLTPDPSVPPAVCSRLGAGISSGFADRVLPGFQDIEAQADAASEAYFDSRMTQVASEDEPWVDEGAAAEDAQEHGFSVYTDLEFVRQQVTGLAIAGLYHLWERLVKGFLERSFRAVDPPVTPQAVRRADFNVVVGWLRERFGWDIEAESFFADLHQLHLVANVVKHRDGDSCDALLDTAPELFRDVINLWGKDPRKADDLRLKREHFLKFTESVVQFIECFPTVERQPVASTHEDRHCE